MDLNIVLPWPINFLVLKKKSSVLMAAYNPPMLSVRSKIASMAPIADLPIPPISAAKAPDENNVPSNSTAPITNLVLDANDKKYPVNLPRPLAIAVTAAAIDSYIYDMRSDHAFLILNITLGLKAFSIDLDTVSFIILNSLVNALTNLAADVLVGPMKASAKLVPPIFPLVLATADMNICDRTLPSTAPNPVTAFIAGEKMPVYRMPSISLVNLETIGPVVLSPNN